MKAESLEEINAILCSNKSEIDLFFCNVLTYYYDLKNRSDIPILNHEPNLKNDKKLINNLIYRAKSKQENVSFDCNLLYDLVKPFTISLLNKENLIVTDISMKNGDLKDYLKKQSQTSLNELLSKCFSSNKLILNYLMIFYYLENNNFLEFISLILIGLFDKSTLMNLLKTPTNINHKTIEFNRELEKDSKIIDLNTCKESSNEHNFIDSIYSNVLMIKEIERIKLIFS